MNAHAAERDLSRVVTSAQGSSRIPLGRWDIAGMLAGFILTIVTTCVLSHGRILWEDELLGWSLLQDPSWHHMLAAWRLGVDGDGFSFLLTGRAWFHIFGASALSFRLYSSTCFGLAFVVVWLAARRFYRVGTVTAALFYLFFSSPVIVMHMTEGRFYGLELLSTALAVWLAFVVAETQGRIPRYLYVAMFVVHGSLITSHLLGIVYSGYLVLAMVVIDRISNRWRPMIYLSAASSWLLLIAERAAILASAQVGNPHFWTTQPNPGEFVLGYSAGSQNIAMMLCLLTITAAISLWRDPEGWQRLSMSFQKRKPSYMVALALLLVPITLFLEGLVGAPLMIYRYLQPVIIALVLVASELLELIRLPRYVVGWVKSPSSARWVYATIGTCLSIFILFRVFVHFRDISFSPKDYTVALNEKLPKGFPVVCEDAYTFTELVGRQHASGIDYVYLLDWKYSVAPAAPRGEVTEFHLMENLDKAGYFPGSFRYLDSFLAGNARFFVVHVDSATHPQLPATIGDPIAQRLMLNPEYDVREYAEMDKDSIRYDSVRYTIWQVCRGHCNDEQALSSQRSPFPVEHQ
jgi:hypothetical protein